jgi:outer membrane lipoprotein-sorting protein
MAMKTRAILLSWVLIALLAPNVATQTTGTGQMVRNALARYQALDSYTGEFIHIYGSPSEQAHVILHRSVKSCGALMRRIEQHAPDHLITIMDGKSMWHFAPEVLQYIERPFERNQEPIETTYLKRLSEYPIQNVASLPDAIVSAEGKSFDCNVVAATFLTPTSKTPIIATLFIDKADGWIRKVNYEFPDRQMTTIILAIDSAANISDEGFRFVPPKNARRVDAIRF